MPPRAQRYLRFPMKKKKGSVLNRLTLSCADCNITVTGMAVYKDHIAGEGHRKKMRQKDLAPEIAKMAKHTMDAATALIDRKMLRANMGYLDDDAADEIDVNGKSGASESEEAHRIQRNATEEAQRREQGYGCDLEGE